MLNIPAASILRRQIQIGKSSVPLGMILLLIIFFVVVAVLNGIYLSRYNRIMTYLKQNHRDRYEQVRLKPNIGPFYSTGRNVFKPLLDLAQQSQTLNDPILAKQLLDFAQFDRHRTYALTTKNQGFGRFLGARSAPKNRPPA